MALTATIFKVDLNISDMDRHYYQSHALTIARHPSETDLRMMARIVAFALNADEQLEFTRGLCADDEPEIWQKDLQDQIEHWIELGQPDPKRLRKACHKARQVTLYSYQDRAARIWLEQHRNELSQYSNLRIVKLPEAEVALLAEQLQRNLSLQCTVQDGQLWASTEQQTLSITPEQQI